MRARTSTQRHAGGSLLRSLRQAAALSQRALATQVGVSHVAVGQWERGEYAAPVDRWAKLADALGGDAALAALTRAYTSRGDA